MKKYKKINRSTIVTCYDMFYVHRRFEIISWKHFKRVFFTYYQNSASHSILADSH